MATTTTNLGLTKPAYTETADIAVINSNMDIIDSAVAALQDTTSTHTSQIATLQDSVSQDVIITGSTSVDGARFFGYTTAGAKDLIFYIPAPVVGKSTVTVSGSASVEIRGGSGGTELYTFNASSLYNLRIENNSLIHCRVTTDKSYPGGNNVAIVGYIWGVTFTLS